MLFRELLKDIEFKLEALPENYFIRYIEETFLPEIKEIHKKLFDKCYEQADSLPVAEFQKEIKRFL